DPSPARPLPRFRCGRCAGRVHTIGQARPVPAGYACPSGGAATGRGPRFGLRRTGHLLQVPDHAAVRGVPEARRDRDRGCAVGLERRGGALRPHSGAEGRAAARLPGQGRGRCRHRRAARKPGAPAGRAQGGV
ncbi:MAG: Iron-sulfur cluster-binding protein, partial [uncultured Rubellimicrobium sp.]